MRPNNDQAVRLSEAHRSEVMDKIIADLARNYYAALMSKDKDSCTEFSKLIAALRGEYKMERVIERVTEQADD